MIIYDRCRNRANIKNRIKEVLSEIAFEGCSYNDFYATESTLSFVMLAYNLMLLFTQVVLCSKVQYHTEMLRNSVVAIEAMGTKM